MLKDIENLKEYCQSANMPLYSNQIWWESDEQ